MIESGGKVACGVVNIFESNTMASSIGSFQDVVGSRWSGTFDADVDLVFSKPGYVLGGFTLSLREKYKDGVCIKQETSNGKGYKKILEWCSLEL